MAENRYKLNLFFFMSKGAESTMLAKCRPDRATAVAAAAIMEAVEDFARRGLRTLVFAHKTLTDDEYREGGPTERDPDDKRS